MSDHQPQLGKLISAGEQRDAIHIAIAPVVAAVKLEPGSPIGFAEPGNIELVRPKTWADSIGIVDPFLKADVKKGERFFMCMHPRSTTGAIRHSWEHPAFIGAEAARKLMGCEESENFIRDWCDENGESYKNVMDAADEFQGTPDGSWNKGNAQVCNNTGAELPDNFWDHWEKVTGRVATHRGTYFPCAC